MMFCHERRKICPTESKSCCTLLTRHLNSNWRFPQGKLSELSKITLQLIDTCSPEAVLKAALATCALSEGCTYRNGGLRLRPGWPRKPPTGFRWVFRLGPTGQHRTHAMLWQITHAAKSLDAQTGYVPQDLPPEVPLHVLQDLS